MEIRLQLLRQQMEIIITEMTMELVFLTMGMEPGRMKTELTIQKLISSM